MHRLGIMQGRLSPPIDGQITSISNLNLERGV